MQKLRHTLALSALSLLACADDSFGKPAWDSNGSAALVRGAGQYPGDAADGGTHDAARAAEDAGKKLPRKPWAATEDSDDAGVHAVEWNTQFVKLRADDFRIAAAGKDFFGQTSIGLNSDPGDDEYTTFEGIWFDHGVEMRLNMYFHADGIDWWADEIRIYNGRSDADWFIAKGEWFRSPLGQPFTGDLDLTLDQPCCSELDENLGSGHLTIRGLTLQAFLTPEVCIQSRGYVIEVLYPVIEMTTAPNSGAGVGVNLRDQRCNIVPEDSAFAFAWTVDDPSLVELSTPFRPTNAQLRGLAAGKTTLRVAASRPDGNVVAEGTMAVIVTAAPDSETP